MVEKPLGCSESEAAQVLASAREFGRIIGVGLLLRFHPAVALANQLINNGELGRLVSLRFVRRTTRNAPEDGNVIEGDAKKVKRQKDIWTFSKDMGSSDPNWRLVATDE